VCSFRNNWSACVDERHCIRSHEELRVSALQPWPYNMGTVAAFFPTMPGRYFTCIHDGDAWHLQRSPDTFITFTCM
jgi:hypothetical protein